jgi:hypothetical protein
VKVEGVKEMGKGFVEDRNGNGWRKQEWDGIKEAGKVRGEGGRKGTGWRRQEV